MPGAAAASTSQRTIAEAFQMNYVFAPEFEELSQGTARKPGVSRPGAAHQVTHPLVTHPAIHESIRILEAAPDAEIINAVWQRREGGRIALITELDNGGKPLVVYNLHLESRGNDHLRLLQLEEVLEDTKRYPPETAVIIAGDLNSKTSHSALIPRLREAGYKSAFGDQRIRTHLFIGALDWVFARGPIEFGRADVLRGIGGSDHFPIVSDVRL